MLLSGIRSYLGYKHFILITLLYNNVPNTTIQYITNINGVLTAFNYSHPNINVKIQTIKVLQASIIDLVTALTYLVTYNEQHP